MTIDRRRFLQTTAAGSAVIALGSTAPGCGNAVDAAPLTSATVDDSPTSPTYGRVTVEVDRYPQLARVGGAITLQLQTLPTDASRSYTVPPDGAILVVQYGSGQFAALQSTCPHAGCPLGYSAKDGLVECPCHSSRFRAVADPSDPTNPSLCAGAVMHAPARSALLSWSTTFDGSNLVIDLTSAVACGDMFPAVANGKVTLPLSTFPQLAMAGGSVNGQPAGLPPLIVARVDASTVVTVASTCTHQGCTVAYTTAKSDFECPCHGSRFATSGAVTNGPATAPLKSYPTAIDGNNIVITVS